MKGDLEGEELAFIPGTVTTWKDWHERYPETTVLRMSRKTHDYHRFTYTDPSDYVIGTKVGTEVKAYTFAYLSEHPIVADEIGGEPILLVFDPVSTRAFVFDRRLDDRNLEFAPQFEEGNLVEVRSRSRWDPWTGTALSGELTGTSLPNRYGIISFRHAWALFYQDAEIVDLPATDPE